MKNLFRTIITPSQCKRNIAQSPDKYSLLEVLNYGILNRRQNSHSFKENTFKLKVLHGNLRIPIPMTFFGNFSRRNSRTVIKGDFRMSRYYLIFLAIWETLVVLVCGFVLFKLIQNIVNPSPTFARSNNIAK